MKAVALNRLLLSSRLVMADMKQLWQALNRVRSFAGQLFLTLGTNGILLLLGLMTGILVARLLGPQGRGELVAIQLWPDSFRGVALLGLYEALAYYSARAPQEAGRYMGSAVTLGFFSAVLFMGIGYLALPVFLSAQPAAVVSAAQWYLLILPLTALIWIPHHALRGRSDFVAWNALRLAPGLAWLLAIWLTWMAGSFEPGRIAMSYVATTALLGIPLLAIMTWRITGPFWPDPQHWRPMVRYGLLSVGGSTPLVLNLRLDQMLMAALLPAHMLGLYVVGVTWSGMIAPLLSALGAVLFPRIAAQMDTERRAQMFTQGSRVAVLATAIITIVVLLCTPWAIMLLFGEQFAAAIPAAIISVVAAAIAGMNQVLEDGLRGFGQPQAVLFAEGGGLLVSVVALLLLLPALGIVGAALASVCGYSTVTLLLIMQMQRLTGCSPASFLRPTRQDVSLSWQQGRSLLLHVMPKAER